MTPEQQKAVLDSVRATLQEARGNQKRRVSENVGMVVDALKKIEADIRAKYDDLGQKIVDRVNSIRDGRDGAAGRDGRDGVDGRPGKDGAPGATGPAGRDGRDGVDGTDGVSVTDAKIDFDGSLVISLSNGREINVGEVVAPDLAERIKVITNGGGTSQTVIDTLASLQQQIDDLIPSQTGNAGKFLTTNGSVLSWADVAGGLSYQGTWNAATNTPTLASSTGTNGYYYVVSVAGTTNLNGITDWQAGDWLIFNGTAWQKIDQSWAIAGANDNITSMTGITGGISSPDFIQFDTGATVTNAAGRLYWDATQQTLSVGLNANIAADIGQTLYAYATNDEAVTINKGQPVYMYSAQGDRVSVKLAYNTGDATSAKTLGVCAENIAAGQAGMILCQGVQDGLDLSAYTAGDTLYLGATAGTLTATKPYAPNHLVYIGVVERANAGNGRLYVRVQNGYELDELHNVSAQNPSNGQVLIYNATTSLWEKNTLTDGTGISITEGAGTITITNSAPDQTVALTAGTGISTSGTYPNFTITNSGVTSITGTTNEIDVSSSTGAVTLSLPATISADITGNAGTVTNGAYVNVSNTFSTSQIISGEVTIGSGDASASPAGNTLRAPNGAGTNIAGGNLNISPGASTGSGVSGYVSFSSGVTPGASGTTQNAMTERMRLYSSGVAADSPTGLQISISGVYPSTVPITNNGDRIASLTVNGLSESSASIGIVNWGSSTGDEPNLNFMALNSGTVGSFGTVPTNGFNLGAITFEGYSGAGSGMLLGAAVIAEATGTWTSTTSPTSLRLQTAAATGASATRILIDKDAVSVEANTGFSISETAITTGSSAIGNVFSGTYTPTLTNTTNVAASTPVACQYMRVGNVVTVSGQVSIDVTTTATDSVLLMTLPITSTFTVSRQCGGTGASSTAGTYGVETIAIMGNVANGVAEFRLRPTSVANLDYRFTFTYLVI